METKMSDLQFHLIINDLQKMALYETKSRFYLIGSNNTQTKFRVLKIDRTEPYELVVTDDKVEYSEKQIKELLSMINEGNRTHMGQRHSTGLTRTVSAFGIVGFVRFLEGYYMILVTKRRKVAVIGLHTIYKVEDTHMIYIPNESVRKYHEDETKYVRLFQNVDLSSNFYFSYSYDLTNSLQYNMAPPKDISVDILKTFNASSKSFESTSSGEDTVNTNQNNSKDTEHEGGPKRFQAEVEVHVKSASRSGDAKNEESKSSSKERPSKKKNLMYGMRKKPNEKYMWNSYLLKPVGKDLHPAWILSITHGFVAQSNISVYGRSFFLTLMARRSCRYAGTRFLKRGANFEGDVANEVETEQLVFDAHVSSFNIGKFTSFVQVRGSIPAHWSQDVSKMVPKPPIMIDVPDPYAVTAGKHFNHLLRRHGAPIVVLNLVKRRERRPHESILSSEFYHIINQLNITLPPQHQIQYVAFDMARVNKAKDENVMSRLSDIAYRAVKKTGIFQSSPPYYSHHLNPDQDYRQLEWTSSQGDSGFGTKKTIEPDSRQGRNQTGVVRVNCVDCLDRTNTAQFSLGKCALAFQLYALGVLSKPFLEWDSDCVRMLEELYEDHGDTLALQYGGSQLVHRIKTYRRTAPWTSQGNDIMQTLSRYYSNTFSDTEKQNAINLFLGLYIANKAPVPIWELTTDYHLHHSLARGEKPCHSGSSSQWWDHDVMEALPLPVDQEKDTVSFLVPVTPGQAKIDTYVDYHRPTEFCILSELFTCHMSHSVRDYMPNFTTDESPFSVRRRPGKRQEELSRHTQNSLPVTIKNPNMSGQASTSSTASSGTSSTESEGSDDEVLSVVSEGSEGGLAMSTHSTTLSLASFFPPMTESYGKFPRRLSRSDDNIYKRYVLLGYSTISSNSTGPPLLVQRSSFTMDNCYETDPPSVPRRSREVYSNHVAMATLGPQPPAHRELLMYQKFASSA
ncbi:polyphosphoinositide phosphatase FIG4 [Oratosquilla oratoria]|uniref:polyphosphoinositide phosphatase FIG4 n=1 Tax=Oratosquilla oratoria TaxID=337810 RepID=UPI003F7654B4